MAIDVEAVLTRYLQLADIRDGRWKGVWEEVRSYVMPTYSKDKSEGGVRGLELFDNTAIEARARLAAGLYNWMAPPDKRWFELVAESEELAKVEEVKDYFSQVSKRMAFAMANSNWPTALNEALNDLACGLDAVVWVGDGGTEQALNFKSYPVETVCYAENEYGRVDTVFRECDMTARQIVSEFPKGNIPERIREGAADPRRMDEKHKIIHAVFPRKERKEGKADRANMPFADVYIDLQSRTVIEEGGMQECPFAVCRFERANNENYGRGPGMNMLKEIITLNRMKETYLLGRERQSDPSWLVPDGSLIDRNFNRDPGSITVYKAGTNGEKPEMLPYNANLNTLYQDIQEQQKVVKAGFFLDIFDPLGDLRQITATEAEIRNEGKLVPFAPLAGNLHSELFRVVIHRVYSILSRRGVLPPLPMELVENPEYKIEFVSKIALSIKKVESIAWLQTEASLSSMAQAKPDIIDNFDFDAIAKQIALSNGVAPEWIRNEKERDAMRNERNAAAAQQMAAEQLTQGVSALGPNLGKAPEDGSPLAAVMNGQGV